MDRHGVKKKVHEEVQSCLWYLLRSWTPNEQRRNGRAHQQRRKARMEMCSWGQQESSMRMQSSENREHTSGGVFVAGDSNLGAVIGKEEGAIESISGNDGRIARACLNERGGILVFPEFLTLRRMDPEEWSLIGSGGKARWERPSIHDESLVMQTCVQENLRKVCNFKASIFFIETSAEVSTCRSRGPKCELIESRYDYVNANRSLRDKITKKEVVEDFESRPHKAVSFVMERGKRDPGMTRTKYVKSTPRLERWKAVMKKVKQKKSREEEDEEKENQERQMRS